MLEVAGELEKGDKSIILGNMKIIGDTGFREVWKGVYKWMEQKAESSGRIPGLLQRAEDFYRKNKIRQAFIAPEKSAALFGKNIYTSISRIERFYMCPYSFFAEYGLKVSERKILKLAMLDIGTFVHGIVENSPKSSPGKISPGTSAFSYRNRRYCPGLEGKILLNLEDIIEGVLANSKSRIFSDSKRYSFLSKRLGRMVARSIEAIAFQISSGDFTPYKFEAAFGTGDEGAYPAVAISDENKRTVARLTGRIDRIDLYEKDGVRYYRVVDYKSGNKEFKMADIFHGLSIQLICYLAAICENDPGASPAGCFYFGMTDTFNCTIKPDLAKIKHERLKSYKMRGLVLEDLDIVYAMDKNVQGYSQIIPVQVKRTAPLKGSYASRYHFEQLVSHTMKNIILAVSKISSASSCHSLSKTGTSPRANTANTHLCAVSTKPAVPAYTATCQN